MAFYLGRGVAFWKPSSEGVKALKHPPNPLAYFPSEPTATLTDVPGSPPVAPGGADDLTDWNEIEGLATHLTQTCERIEELAERTEGMLRRVEQLAASTTSQLEHTGLLPTAVQIASVREEIANAMAPRRHHHHHHHGWRGWVQSTYARVRPEVRARWLVARVKIGRHLSVPARHAKAALRKQFVLARLSVSARSEQMMAWATNTLTPLAPPSGVKVVIQPLHAPRVRVPAIFTFAGATAFCAAVVLLLVAISATTPALGLPAIVRPAVAMTVPGPKLVAELLAAPGAMSTLLAAGAADARRPDLATKPLQRSAAVGTLVVESDPIGATVFVNQERVGETPLTLPQVRAGSRVIWVESDGYQRWSAGVVVPAEKLTRLNVKLTREAREPRK